MSKITYVDDENQSRPRYRGVNSGAGKFVVLFLILSFAMGLIGGVGSLLVLSSNKALKEKLGIDLQNLNLTHVTAQKFILEESSTVIDSSKKVSPAVVSITSSQDVMDYFGQVVGQSQAAGTGFIFTNDGYILTNKHVASDTNATYSIFTSDGKKYDGKVVAQDPLDDIAIIKVDAKGLPVVDLGNSDEIQVGQWVIAIGNALGELQNTVTVGIISARERQVSAGNGNGQSESLENLLQTDAAINSGNSGGPLINLAGQVIGINTAVAGNAQGIGFAIPINTAKAAINSFQKNGKIVRPLLGVRYTMVTSEIQQTKNLPVDYGALIYGGKTSGVVAGGAADKAGLKNNDIIVAINGDRIDKNHSLGTAIQKYNPGDKIEITYLRDKKESKTTATLSSTN